MNSIHFQLTRLIIQLTISTRIVATCMSLIPGMLRSRENLFRESIPDSLVVQSVAYLLYWRKLQADIWTWDFQNTEQKCQPADGDQRTTYFAECFQCHTVTGFRSNSGKGRVRGKGCTLTRFNEENRSKYQTNFRCKAVAWGRRIKWIYVQINSCYKADVLRRMAAMHVFSAGF